MISNSETYLLNLISDYDGSILQLGRLIARLDAIFESRADWTEIKRKNFRSNWGVLEQIYAEALDKRSQKLSARDIFDSRANLKLIKDQLIR